VAHLLKDAINLVVSSKDEEFLSLLKDCPLFKNGSDVRNETGTVNGNTDGSVKSY
jgi:hypothetical protein